MQAHQLVDHFLRTEYGKAVSLLSNRFGGSHIELAEDAVQEALIKAMQTWPYNKVPDNPTGWILRVAGNKMIDQLRRDQKTANEAIPEKFEELSINLESINDDLVRMIFACCHPSISEENQIILTLKILCGLSVREISCCLLKKEEAVAKAYTRAKKKFKVEEIKLVLPPANEIEKRLEIVLKIIYLLFNEGYKSTEGENLIREELCEEAIRLNAVLIDNEICDTPSANALMALMHFNASRFEARVDENGEMLNLENQDRSKWDKQLINNGIKYLEKATDSGTVNEYLIQAGINSFHCTAPNFEHTNWNGILDLYDMHVEINSNPIIQLNRIIPLEKVHGSILALAEINRLEKTSFFETYYLFYAIKAGVLENLNEKEESISSYTKAIGLTKNQREINYLNQKISSIKESL